MQSDIFTLEGASRDYMLLLGYLLGYYSCNRPTDTIVHVVWGTSPMPLCFQRNHTTFVKAHFAQMIFITTSNIVRV